ncbi:MAG: amidohydrolase family protein [Phycisphaerales bacterium JB063]
MPTPHPAAKTTDVSIASTAGSCPISDANRLGLDYRREAEVFGYDGPIIDIHSHVSSPESARVFFEAADDYGVDHVWTMTGLDNAKRNSAELEPELRDRLHYIAVPDYAKRDAPDTFTTQWHRDIVSFYELGSRIMKLWAAPRARDFAGDELLLDSPNRLEGIRIAYETGYRIFMTHVGDPDTWFQTVYTDASRYGTKRQQFEPLAKLLDQYHDVTWIGAHMGGNPEDLDWLHGFMEAHPNYVVDTSATKWQIRELSKHPERFVEFVEANPGRVLFGSDIVASADNYRAPADAGPTSGDGGTGYDLYASRYWALRAVIETDYQGPSPIVDPDLSKVDPSADPLATAALSGASMPDSLLESLYHGNAAAILGL